MSAHRKRPAREGPTFTPNVVGHVVERMLEDSDRRRRETADRRSGAAKPVSLSTGRWLRCPDCGGKGGDCPRCHGDGEILQAAPA